MPIPARWAFAVLFISAVVPARAADYQTNLGPMPLDDETKAVIAGRGDATARYDGKTLTVKGSFHGLPSSATEAHLFLSEHIGVPGRQALDLTVTKATSGSLSGSFNLTPEQANALRLGHLYIQVNSEKAPPGYSWGPKGTLWGWLLPAHKTAGQDVPQAGHWFIPQLDTPSR
ncbi:MAG: CHRD domain-containing protein [Alphaproteobacteria bacterium]|nr:CHRD domain-containing protein [Alphaproteobacteria bacterium]